MIYKLNKKRRDNLKNKSNNLMPKFSNNRFIIKNKLQKRNIQIIKMKNSQLMNNK